MKIWTPEERKKIADLYKEGFTYAEIAERYGVKRNAISGVLHRHRHPDAKAYRRSRRPMRDAADPRRNLPYHTYKDLKPSREPFAADATCPDFALDELHCASVYAARKTGFPVMPEKTEAPAKSRRAA